ncbi:hypothetical protein [Tomitella fengzijianii]|uniref:Uncharacterized protein n=1 Tax=Tomitella fengzijianii TaxID=2597660 RepID=A0A516X0Y3_9ACTN|nr:hypothetical protein [Tomitella fengzijianii]QDQ96728.1 hypothetical protein FO059_04430 [Tomitella fengzijianii]
MTDFGAVERYQAYRTRRFLEQQRRFSTRLRRLRTRPARRTLVVLLCALYAAMIIIAVLTYWDITAAYWSWLGATAALLVLWPAVQIVSGRQGDAPRDALDEYELQLRNSARSIGLTITQIAAFVPAAVLIFITSGGGGSPQLAYMGGLLVVTALLIGGTSPTLILAWTRPDPEPEDGVID